MTDDEYRNEAILQYGDDDIQIDMERAISRADDGAWVPAWVWVTSIEEEP